MRDPGLDQAIRAAGGVGALARKIGIAQPSVSNWSRIPAERVLAVETATGIPRQVLRPDLYDSPQPVSESAPSDVDDIERARAQTYALLAVLLARAPSVDLLARLAKVRGDASPLGQAHSALAEAAASATVENVEREFFNLFIGIGRGELVPYGSYYLTGFLNERPLARLRDDLARLGIARVTGYTEPEDHAAVVCDIMAGLAEGRFTTPPGADRDLFDRHLAPWIGRFFADLERAQVANFYRHVGTIGRLFAAIEGEAFTLAA
ncbi:MAG TPA: molecular chaperone TorD family protein [Xanthobacteraceae bacterium]|jgi:TorA maturation chaperone TorD